MNGSQIQTNGHKSQSTDWQTASVQDFFNAISWTGESIEDFQPHATKDGGDASALLNPCLSVNKFFSYFHWDGKPSIATAVESSEGQPNLFPQEDELDLDVFADFF